MFSVLNGICHITQWSVLLIENNSKINFKYYRFGKNENKAEVNCTLVPLRGQILTITKVMEIKVMVPEISEFPEILKKSNDRDPRKHIFIARCKTSYTWSTVNKLYCKNFIWTFLKVGVFLLSDDSGMGIFFTNIENVGPSIGITIAILTVVIIALVIVQCLKGKNAICYLKA